MENYPKFVYFIRDDEDDLAGMLGNFITSTSLMHDKFIMFVEEDRIQVLASNIKTGDQSLAQALLAELLRRRELGCRMVTISCFESRHLIFEF